MTKVQGAAVDENYHLRCERPKFDLLRKYARAQIEICIEFCTKHKSKVFERCTPEKAATKCTRQNNSHCLRGNYVKEKVYTAQIYKKFYYTVCLM